MLRRLCARMLPSGAGGSGPGHIGPLTIHMGIRSIAMSSSYRRMMHGWIWIAARKLQVTQEGIRWGEAQGPWQRVLQREEGCSDTCSALITPTP